LYQPNYTRVRHRYRGPRESPKVNQELDQILADLSQLEIDITEAENELTTQISNILDGVTYSNITYTDEDATPTDSPIALKSMISHAKDLTVLEERIKRLQNG
jgi:hypothetical protein